ncbi:MAG: hypothetical protein GYB64_02730 [Chloroflexi bacterium]|nr:hypothetical protein [Chloroflexota bacterium]
MTRRIHIIINPASGENDLILNTLNDGLHDGDIEWDVTVTHEQGDGTRLARKAIERGDVDILAVYGGDGTLGEVAAALAGTDLPMMPFAGGTGNAFARSVDIPLELAKAVSILSDKDSYTIEAFDTCRVNDEYVFIVGGATGMVANTFSGPSRKTKDEMGMMAYPMALLQEMLDSKPLEYHLTIDDEEVTVSGVSCLVSNSGPFNLMGLSVMEKSDPRDGKVDVYMIEGDKAGMLLSALVDMTSINLPAKGVPHWRAEQVRIDCIPSEAGKFFFDGGITLDLPVDIRVDPASLRVVKPHKARLQAV